jgi:hypothetical protein
VGAARPDRRGALAAAINRAVVWRACPVREEIERGWVTADPRRPLVHHLNTVRLSRCPSADELVALSEEWQAGRRFRRVVIEDAEPAERLAAWLEPRGWSRERVVLMALDPAAVGGAVAGAVAVAVADPRAREIDEATMAVLERRIFAEDNAGRWAHPDLPEQMSGANAAMRAATGCRRFAAGDGAAGELASMATLYLDPDVCGERVALVESVGTLAAWRERGLGGAAVGAALGAARDWRADLVAIVTDADDWPQVWYAALGFEVVGRHVGYVRTTPGG